VATKKKKEISKFDQMMAAMDSGDIEKAKALGHEIAAEQGTSLVLPRKAKSKTPAPIEDDGEAPALPTYVNDQDEAPLRISPHLARPAHDRVGDDSWIAPARTQGGRLASSGIDAFGQPLVAGAVRMRTEPIGQNFHNTYKDDGKGGKLPSGQAKIDKVNGRKNVEIERRDPAIKYKVRCRGCLGTFQVYLTEMIEVTDETGRREYAFDCDRCVVQRGR
jgi:hypothetical protein